MSAPNDIGLYWNFSMQWTSGAFIASFTDTVVATSHDQVIVVPQDGTVDCEVYFATLASGDASECSLDVSVFPDGSAAATTYGPDTIDPIVLGIPGNTFQIPGIPTLANDRWQFRFTMPGVGKDPGYVAGYVLLTYV